MSTLHSFTFVLHIIFGSMALILFWLPLASKKGSLDHIKFGRYYAKVMYVVAASGAVMAMLVIYSPLIPCRINKWPLRMRPATFEQGVAMQ
jgi:hypothetical protein